MAGKYAFLKLRAGEAELEPVTEVNIIPVIDISLVLLVILFVTAPLLSYPNLPVELPKASSKESSDKTVAVTYALSGRMAVGSRDVDWRSLAAVLDQDLRRVPDGVVILRVDRSVPYSVVGRLLAAVKGAGARQVALATDVPK